MNITRENTGEYTASLTVEVTPEDFMPKVNTNLEKIRKKATIQGFRPGKAPMGLVKRNYGKNAILEEVNNLAYDEISKYIEENKIKIIGYPLMNTEKTNTIEEIEENISYSFVFDIGIVPEFEVNLSSDVEIEYKKVPITDTIIDKEIENLQTKHANFDKTDIATEDCLVTGKLITHDDSKTEDAETSTYRYFRIDTLKENKKVFQSFLGAKSKDVITIKSSSIENRDAIKFLIPESTDINDKNLKFTFTIEEMYTSKPAEINEDFFVKVLGNKNIKTLEEFRTKLKENMEVYFSRQFDELFYVSSKNKLVKDTELPLPTDFLKVFIKEANKNDKEFNATDFENNFDSFYENIKWEFIQSKIFQQFDIKVDIEDFKNYIRDFHKQHSGIDEVSEEQIQNDMKQIVSDKKNMDGIESSIRQQKAVSVFKEKFKVKEVTFDSFENLQKAVKEEVEKPMSKEKKKTKSDNKKEKVTE